MLTLSVSVWVLSVNWVYSFESAGSRSVQGRELFIVQTDQLTRLLTCDIFTLPIVRIDKVHSACVKEGRTRLSIQCFLFPVKRSYCALYARLQRTLLIFMTCSWRLLLHISQPPWLQS